MYAAGYYKTNYRALRLGELARMHGFWRGLRGYVVSRFMRPAPTGWMPGVWSEIQCRQEDLSELCLQATKPHRADLERLGFNQCIYSKARNQLNPLARDSGGVTYLEATGKYVGQLLFARFYHPAQGRENNTLIIGFTATFDDGSSFSVTNNRMSFDPPDKAEVIRLDSHDVSFVYQEFQRRLAARTRTPRTFPDLGSLCQWFDARQIKTFEDRVRRGLFAPMSDAEVTAAKARLPSTGSASPPPIPQPRLKLNWILWLGIVAAILFLQFIRAHSHHGNKSEDTIDYQGQQFKMRKAYGSYEDYKDDPDNLNTNELERIELTMTSVKAPASFENRREFVRFLFGLKFPGYGLGGVASRTDDGSVIETQSVEIPQRDKERYIVVRQAPYGMKLLDDFVQTTATNAITRVQLEKQKLRYYDIQNKVVREKPL